MPFLENAWYPAAMASEIGRTPFHRILLDRDVLLYRQEDGAPVGIENVCPHRFVPLHLGQIIGDTIECPYHGLRFNGQGVCVVNPHGGPIPGAKARGFPIVERHRLIWIWPGDKDLADPASIPFCPAERTETSVSTMDYMHFEANYLLMVDNLLDNSHTDFLHRTSFGGNAGAHARLEILEDGDAILCNRSFSGGNLSPTISAFTDYRGPVDRWQDMRWSPPAMLTLTTGATPAGRPREEGFFYTPWQILTPETPASTHLFFGKARNFNIDDREMDARMASDMRDPVYNEDKPMIEAQQRIIGDRELDALKPALFGVDVGAVKVRRRYARLLAAEALAREARA